MTNRETRIMDSHQLGMEAKFLKFLVEDYQKAVEQGDALLIKSALDGLQAHISLCRVWLAGIGRELGDDALRQMFLKPAVVDSDNGEHSYTA